ncbi:hypothetical protein JCM5353_007625 [Sporobolomyces roseus]
MFSTSRTLLPSVFALLALTSTVSAQTATEISTQMNQLALVIPEACVSLCTPWQQAFQQCPAANDLTPDYQQCTCQTDFVSNFNACTGCMANTLNEQGDTTNAAIATAAPGDLSTYCASTAGALTSSSSTTSELTTSTTESIIPTTTSSTEVFASTTSLPLGGGVATSSSSSSTSSSEAAIATGVVAGAPFPSQTKQPSVFSNGGGQEMIKLSGGVLVGLFGAIMML